MSDAAFFNSSVLFFRRRKFSGISTVVVGGRLSLTPQNDRVDHDDLTNTRKTTTNTGFSTKK